MTKQKETIQIYNIGDKVFNIATHGFSKAYRQLATIQEAIISTHGLRYKITVRETIGDGTERKHLITKYTDGNTLGTNKKRIDSLIKEANKAYEIYNKITRIHG